MLVVRKTHKIRCIIQRHMALCPSTFTFERVHCAPRKTNEWSHPRMSHKRLAEFFSKDTAVPPCTLLLLHCTPCRGTPYILVPLARIGYLHLVQGLDTCTLAPLAALYCFFIVHPWIAVRKDGTRCLWMCSDMPLELIYKEFKVTTFRRVLLDREFIPSRAEDKSTRAMQLCRLIDKTELEITVRAFGGSLQTVALCLTLVCLHVGNPRSTGENFTATWT